MRVSTSQLFANGISTIQRGQADLAHTQLQLSTGRKFLSPSDDPGAAVQALNLCDKISAVDQFARNGVLTANRLQQEESVLANMGTGLQRIRELTVQAANATQTNESRSAIALELRQIAEELLASANTRDANGEYLFAGFRSANRPFVENAAGEIEYLGDRGQRQVEIAPGRTVAAGDSGDAFMQIPHGNGVFTVTPDSGNAGSAWVTGAEVIDPGAVTSEAYEIRMTSAADYEIVDSSATVVASGTFVPGQAIDIGGRRIVLEGEPAAGDVFAVEPAGTQSVFAIVDALATALETPRHGDAEQAQLSHSTGAALLNLDQGLERVFDMRSQVGARLSTIDSYGYAGEERKVQMQSALSGLEDLDYAEAISRLALQQTALEAAQQTFAQLGRLSLFNFIR